MAMDKYGLCERGVINIFDKQNKYIEPRKNNIVEVLFKDKSGQTTCLYKVTEIIQGHGSDYLYSNDNINVDLQFVKYIDHIDFEELKNRTIERKRQNCMHSDKCEDCRFNKDGKCYDIEDIIKTLEE